MLLLNPITISCLWRTRGAAPAVEPAFGAEGRLHHRLETLNPSTTEARPPAWMSLDRRTLPRSCRATQRLRRLAEGADEGAAHPLRIAKAGRLRDALDRLTGRLHALPRHFDP